MFGSKRARPMLAGRVALLTGPRTPLALAAARWIGHSGGLLAIVGADVGRDPGVGFLEHQFPGRVLLVPRDVDDVDSAQSAAARAEDWFGRVDVWIHTLGASTSPLAIAASCRSRPGPTPLGLALTCSLGAARFMGARQHGHIVHLITREDVGAAEVANVAIRRLKQAWADEGLPGSVSMSAILFDETATLAPPSPYLGDAGLLAAYTARALEEDDWAERVFAEREIGTLIANVLAVAQGGQPGTAWLYEFRGAERRSARLPA